MLPRRAHPPSSLHPAQVPLRACPHGGRRAEFGESVYQDRRVGVIRPDVRPRASPAPCGTQPGYPWVHPATSLPGLESTLFPKTTNATRKDVQENIYSAGLTPDLTFVSGHLCEGQA